MRLRVQFAVLALALAMVMAACGGTDNEAGTDAPSSTAAPDTTAATTSSSAAPTTTATTTTTSTTTTTAAPSIAGEVVPTPVNTFMTSQGNFPAEQLPFPDGTVMVYWYQAQNVGLWTAVFKGWDVDNAGPWCPGGSILLLTGQFDFISNSPSEPGGCDDPENRIKLATPPAGFRNCGGLAYYVTEVPIEEQGFVYATIERVVDGGFVTTTSQAQTAETPDFVVDATTYTLPGDFLASGATEVSC